MAEEAKAALFSLEADSEPSRFSMNGVFTTIVIGEFKW
jgi:hypothetical protein